MLATLSSFLSSLRFFPLPFFDSLAKPNNRSLVMLITRDQGKEEEKKGRKEGEVPRKEGRISGTEREEDRKTLMADKK